MTEMERLKIDFWKAVFEIFRFRQENGMTCEYRELFAHELDFYPGILKRMPDLRGVDIDEDLVTGWLSYESLSADERSALLLRETSNRNRVDSTLPGEEWKPVNDFPDYYISSFGRVWSLKRKDGLMVPQLLSKGRKTPRLNKRRLFVDLKDKSKGQYRRVLVHRLVAEAFIPNPNNYPQIDHIDENPQNNRADNLRWCTQEQNLKYYANRHYITD